MTRRERLENRVERRREWADKAKTASTAAFNTAHRIADAIPFGQPILVGHHSERHARRDQARIHSNMDKGCERADMANNHISKADSIESALDRSIFSDDENAVEALEQRIAEREAEREQMKLVNKFYRKGDAVGLSNLGGRITADRKRLEYIKQQNARKAKAEESPNGVTIETGENWHGYCRITFAEKPDREILSALRSAGFSWGSGSWSGKVDSLPESVKELV